MAKRLTEQHPFHQKVNDLMNYMQEQNLSLVFHNEGTTVMDLETKEEYLLTDMENYDERVQELPYPFEFKLIIPE